MVVLVEYLTALTRRKVSLVNEQVVVRTMQQADLPAVVKIQDNCYSDTLFESPDLVALRLASHPSWCWVAEHALADGSANVLAYLFSYPSLDGKVAKLGSKFAQYRQANVLYLHDMAVSDSARGFGLAQQLLVHAQAQALANGLTRLALVAVQGSVPYWQRQGFTVKQLDDDAAALALASYTGQHATYMQKLLPNA